MDQSGIEIADGVFFFRGRTGERLRPGAGSVNVIVVRGAALAMLDAGVKRGRAFRSLRARMSACKLDPGEIAWLAPTHSHWDHINASDAVQRAGRARLAAPRAEVPFIENPDENFRGFLTDFGLLAREVFPYPAVLARLAIRYAWGRQPRLHVDRALDDGDVLEVGREVRAVALPGHTTGHAGYWIPDAGVLVAGDLIDFENSQGMDLNNPRSDFGMALQSLRRALELEPEILIPAHGEPTVGQRRVGQVLNAALAGGLEYPERIRAALGNRALRIGAIAPAVFPDVPLSMRAMTMMLVLVVLLHMERAGQVQRTELSGRPAWARLA
jgi:glyoxylase-like metal-dependent hydrolase (beta-lactamase superfamily II)